MIAEPSSPQALGELAAGCDWPACFHCAIAVADGLLLKVHGHADMVHQDLELVADVEGALTLGDVDEAMLLVHLVEECTGRIQDFAEAHASVVQQAV